MAGFLLQGVVEALVERTSQHRLKLFTHLFGVGRFQVRVERGLIFPDADNGEMVFAGDIHQHFEAHNALVLAAVDGEVLQEPGAVGGVIGREIHVRDDVELAVLRGKRQTDCEKQKGR